MSYTTSTDTVDMPTYMTRLVSNKYSSTIRGGRPLTFSASLMAI